MMFRTEFHIGIIYFAGLLCAIIASILTFLYLRPIKTTINKIAEKSGALWNHSFKTTILLAGLLGAMSVTFKDCNGSYEYLLESKHKTIMKGFEQVSDSFGYLALVLGLWLLIFFVLRLISKKNKLHSS